MLIIRNDYKNPEDNYIEVTERKGIGHPDTLADMLALECSKAYAKYCLNNYGCVLHYNLDKLYIGGGLFKYEGGRVLKKSNIIVNLNGRVTNTMNGEKIDLNRIFKPVIKKYLKAVLPRLDVDNDLTINVNSTQNTKRDYWYTPRNIDDVPDCKNVTAGDTALCVAHGDFTFCEKLALYLESILYDKTENGYMTPRYKDIGQDIKFMVSRIGKKVEVTICLPVLKGCYKSDMEYDKIIKKYERLFYKSLDNFDNPKGYKVFIRVNYKDDGTIDKYALCIGTCAECGEEGVVGRGNDGQGLISAFRPHTVEAPFGKNVRYHTGFAVSFMAKRAVYRIYNELGIRCMIYAITRNRNSLYDPYVFYLSVDRRGYNDRIRKIILEEFNANYLEKIFSKEENKWKSFV